MIDVTSERETSREAARYLIAMWSEEDTGSLVSRKVVVDRLLDVRNLLEDEDVGVVDRILEDIPGITVVESGWWLDQLAGIDTKLAGRAETLQH